MSPATPTSNTGGGENISVGPFWFVLAALGMVANFVGGCIWLGTGPALFISGALAVVLSQWQVGVFLWVVIAVRRVAAERRRGESSPRA